MSKLNKALRMRLAAMHYRVSPGESSPVEPKPSSGHLPPPAPKSVKMVMHQNRGGLK